MIISLLFVPFIINYIASLIRYNYVKNVIYVISSFFYLLFLFFILRQNYEINFLIKEIFNNILISFKFDNFTKLYLFIVSILYPIATIYAICYFKSTQQDNSKFHILSAAAVGFSILIISAVNLFISFIFYEILTLVTYFLIVYDKNYNTFKNGYKYLIILSFTSFFFFVPGILNLYNVTENLNFQPLGTFNNLPVSDYFVNFTFFLILVGVGKNTLLPFNMWLIFAMVAPVPVSSLLHSVLVVKIGILLSIKIIYQIYSMNILQTHIYKIMNIQWIYLMPIITIVYSGLNAITSENIKKRLAYSTISHICYILLISLMSKELSFKYIIMHSFAKINLFFFAGYLSIFYKITTISEMKKIHLNYFIRFSIFLSILSLIGIGPTAGLMLKEKIFECVLQEQNYLNLALFIFLIFSSFLTCFYMKPFLLFLRQNNKKNTQQITASYQNYRTVDIAMTIIMTFNSLAVIILFFEFDAFAKYLFS